MTNNTKCERCNNNKRLADYELCKPCIHELIVPGYSATFIPDESMQKEIRRANGFD